MNKREKINIMYEKLKQIRNYEKELIKQIRVEEQLLKKYDMFYVYVIAELLIKLINEVTGENYVSGSQNITIKNDKMYRNDTEFSIFYIKNINSNIKVKYLTNLDTTEIIVLNKNYLFDDFDNIINMEINEFIQNNNIPAKINFINDFLKQLYDYRIDNELEDITLEQINIFYDQYINSNKEKLQKKYFNNKTKVLK